MHSLKQLATKNKALLAIIVLSVFIKILLLLQASVVNRDAAVYIAAAQKFSCGMFAEGIQHYPMPLYPLLLAALHLIVPDWVLAGRLLSLLPLVLCLIPLYFLTLRLFDQHSARATALLFAVLPVFNTSVVGVVRDPLFLLLALGTLASVAQYNYHSSHRVLICAVALAVLATLIRIEGVILLALVPALFVWEKRRNFNMRLLVQALCTFLSAFLVLGLAIWGFSFFGIVNQSRMPEVLVWGKGLITLDIFSDYRSLMAELKQLQQQLPAANLRNNIVESARHYAPIVYALGLTEILIKEVFPTSLLALWGLRRCPRLEKISPTRVSKVVVLWPWCAFIVLNLLFSVIYNFSTTRYMWMPIALTLPFVGLGISLWWRMLKPGALLAWLLMGVFFGAPALKSVADMPEKRTSIIEAGKWLLHHDAEQHYKVLFNDRRLALYAGRADTPHYADISGTTDAQEFLNYAVDGFMLLVEPSELKLLPPPGFIEIVRFTDEVATVVVLYREDQQP